MTLRMRLTLLATTLVMLVLALSSVVIVQIQGRVLTRGVDEALAQRADNVEAQVGALSPGAALPGEGDPEDSFLLVLEESGAVRSASPNVTRARVGVRPTSTQLLLTVSLHLDATESFRVLTRPLPADPTATLVVGKNLDDVRDSVRVLTYSLAAAVPIIVLVLAAMAWWLTGRALRPVEEIRTEVAAITGSQLHRRVPVVGANDEISRLALTMNSMLERVQQATDRQRQFVADASHELRSPLARLRSSLEVGIAHPQSLPPGETLTEALHDAQELQQLLDDLLFLARSEAGSDPLNATDVDLDDLVLSAAAGLRAAGGLEVDIRQVSAARVHGDARQLARAIRNVVDNARRHATSRVAFELSERDGRSVLAISDDGPGVPEGDRERVFSRFTRLDVPRTRDAGGSGLGLAIVRDIVGRHGGTVAVVASPRGGAQVVMSFPGAH